MRIIALLAVAGLVAAGAAFAKDAPDSPAKPKIVEGDKLGEAGKWDEAITLYREAEKLDPKNFEAKYSIAIGYLETKRLGEATTAIRAAIDVDPEDLGGWKLLAAIGLQAKSDADVERAATELLKRDPGMPEPHRYRGDSAWAKEKWQTAYDHYQRAVAADPRVKRGKSSVAAAALKLGRKDEALALLAEVAAVNGKFLEAVKKDKKFEVLWNDPKFLALKGRDIVAGSAEPGKSAPLFALASLESDSQKASLEAYRGKLVLVNFWATW